MKLHLRIGSKRMLNKAHNQAMRLEALARSPGRLQTVRAGVLRGHTLKD